MIPKTTAIVCGLGAAWIAVLAVGFTALGHEEFTPVAETKVLAKFPVLPGTGITLATDRPTLLLFLHPHCPCSRATLYELDRFRADTRDHASTVIVFTLPPGVPPHWEQGELWDAARQLSGVRVVRDVDGVAAKSFGIVGSGHALLYASDGRLLFSGGITESRGHEGDNRGLTAIVQGVLVGRPGITHTPVYGCSLL